MPISLLLKCQVQNKIHMMLYNVPIDGKPNHVVIATFYLLNKCAAQRLDTVGTCFIHRLAFHNTHRKNKTKKHDNTDEAAEPTTKNTRQHR